MNQIPIYDATVPVACSASSGELEVRTRQLDALRGRLDGVERTEHGLLFHFPDDPDLRAEVTRFATAEKACCPFWGFAVTSHGGRLTLRWDGPPEAAELLDRMAEFAAHGDRGQNPSSIGDVDLLGSETERIERELRR